MIALDPLTPAEREASRSRSMTRNSDRTRANIIAGCRGLLWQGNFRPTVAAIAQRARVSMRTVFHYFPTVEGLYVAAIDNDLVLDLHWRLERLDPAALVKAAVLGRLPE